ncbi:phage minor tail protein L [Hyphomonas sp.]|uniref:phage minor tail protein L n=1 Tax=Hyphomonas sp. TaxID=87 RepID=UPI000C8C7404|nr:phage minor tail protein L [Hyphomonas sp.]MAL46834.1 phage minor tail protein L [Hyphomonas sp.]
MSTTPVFNDLQSINPSGIIELFSLQLDSALHGSNTIYRFHNGSSLNANGEIVWAGNSYLRFPLIAEGFAYQRGQLPRPTLTISNLSAAPSISALMLSANEITPGNDLTGSTVTRIRTLAKFLDNVNFSGNSNPFGTPDPNAEFPREIYYIDRKATETRDVVSWELAAVFDLAGVRVPKRQCTRSEFPSIGTFV